MLMVPPWASTTVAAPWRETDPSRVALAFAPNENSNHSRAPNISVMLTVSDDLSRPPVLGSSGEQTFSDVVGAFSAESAVSLRP